MATLVLGAAGAAVGGALGGGVLGISGAVIGRAIGATVGRVIDERLLGASAPVESGGPDRLHVAGAGEGDPIPRVWGQMRVAGHVIWAGEFRQQTVAGGGKGGGGGGGETELRVSLALGLCEGPIAGIGRIWADGTPLEPTSIDLRVYPGDEAQLPDPLIEAVEGAENAPAYRGLAYVVIEDLDLGRFGNRIPQLWFEVLRRADVEAPAHPADVITGVALIPGTGEYALATTPVTLGSGPGQGRRINVNTPSGRSDLETSLDALARELPGARSVSLVVSWFGDDLAAGRCTVAPRVEGRDREGLEMPWRVSGLTRAEAREVGRVDGRPAFGGTPCDHSVIEAIRAIHAAGREVMFYPFVLMDIQAGNGLPDPWSGAA
ncbi:MAG: host specificity protein, partial [Alphaproteobacteria bacterium]